MNMDLNWSSRKCTPTAARCEPLEARNLFAAYVDESIAEHFDLPGVLYDLSAPAGSIAFGAAGIGLGDVDGDGKGDFAISAIGSVDGDGATTTAGAVFVYSGATGSVLRTLGDTFADFGMSLAKLGDLDGDGVAELVVGSPRFDSDSDTAIDPTGAAYVYSGATGSLLRTFLGTQANSEFGHVIAAVGLADGDALPDVMVGAPNDGPENQGRVYILSSAEAFVGLPGAEIIYTFTGEASGDLFGFAIAPADLQDFALGADPAPDYLIGAPGNDAGGANAGRAYVYRQADGSQGFTISNPRAGDEFGHGLIVEKTAMWVRIVIGSPGYDIFGGADGGNTQNFGPDGSPIDMDYREGTAGVRYGSDLFEVGLVDGDDDADFAVTRPGAVDGTNAVVINIYYDPRPVLNPTYVFVIDDVNDDTMREVVYLSRTDGKALVVPQGVVVPPQEVSGANDDLSVVYYSGTEVSSGGGVFVSATLDYAFINGVYTATAAIPGFRAGDTIRGVNISGLYVGFAVTGRGAYGGGSITERFIVRDGVRTTLADAVTQVVGGITPDLDAMSFVKVGNEGSILMSELHAGERPRAWVLSNGVLTFLWIGSATDINESGLIVGARYVGDDFDPEVVVRDLSGGITVLDGWRSVGGVNNAGLVAGINSDFDLVAWQSGNTVILSDLGEVGNPLAGIGAVDVNERGEIIAQVSLSPIYFESSAQTRDYVYLPDESRAQLVLHGTMPTLESDRLMKLAPNGDILRMRSFLRRLNAPERWDLLPDSPVSCASANGTSVTVGLNAANEVVAFGAPGGPWRASPHGAEGAFHEFESVVAYTDPVDGRAYAFAIDSTGAWLTAADPSAESALNLQTPHLIGGASVFTLSDGQVVLAGLSLTGDLLILFKTNPNLPSSSSGWTLNNLALDHVQAGGQSYVQPTGGTTGFSTRWGAMNVVYLDDAGIVHAVWWAPGMGLWRTDNLSESAGAPAIHGGLKAFTTAWDAMNIIGTDDSQRPVAIWCVPGASGWMYDDRLTAESDTPGLDPSSLVVYTTPWNAMNIIGRDADTGRTIAYWWAPGMIDWRVDELIIPSRPEGVITTGELTGGMAANTQAIFGREASTGHLIELFWMPGQTDWDIADITDLVA